MRAAWWVLVAACGGDSSQQLDAGGGDAAFDATIPTMTIHGTGIRHAVTDTGVVDVPVDYSMAHFDSITPSGGRFVHLTGSGMAGGTFDVPVGAGASSWYLGVPVAFYPQYLAGNSSAPDLSYFTLGRPDAVVPTSATSVTVNATGLAPWQATDDLEILSSNTGALIVTPQGSFATQLATGDTSISGQSFSWSALHQPLVDASKGDTVSLFQLATKTSGASSYRALAKFGTATGFTQTSGTTSTMNVTLANATPAESLAIQWQRSQFAAQRALAGPGAVDEPSLQLVYIDALPGATSRAQYAGAPDLAVFQPPTGTTDLALTVDYANPFGAGWDELVGVVYVFHVPELAPGATSPADLIVGVQAQLPVSGVRANATIALPMSAPRNIRIAGLDASQPQTGVGAIPTASWDPPAIGTPTAYQVQITSVTALGTGTHLRILAKMFTKQLSLQIPDGFLSPGTTYVINIAAIDASGIDITAMPSELQLPFAACEVATAQFTP